MPDNIELPAPLTPADCDLRSFPFMPLDVVRLWDSDLAATASGDEFRAAVLLWCKSWHQIPAASVPNDDRILAKLAGFGRDKRGWDRVKPIAMRGFILCNDGRLYHPVVAEKAMEAFATSRRQSFNAKKRWSGSANPDANEMPPDVPPNMPRHRSGNATDTDTDKDNTPIPPEGASRFDEFWQQFPSRRKTDKAKCRKLWANRNLDSIAAEVFAGLQRWLASKDWAKDDGEYIPGPHPWLNKSAWEASPKPAVANGEPEIVYSDPADIVRRLQEAS